MNKKILTLVFLLLFLALGFTFIVKSVSAQSFTIPQKQSVCDTLNLTFIECGQLWLYYDDYINGSLETIIYVQNETVVYVNSTTGELQNDSDKEFRERQAQRDHEYRLAQLEVEKAGKTETASYTQEELDLAISKALSDNKPPANQQQPSAYVPPTQSPQNDYFPWVLGAIGIAVVFFFYRKYASGRGDNSFMGMEQQFYQPTPAPQSYYESQHQQPEPPRQQQYKPLPVTTNFQQQIENRNPNLSKGGIDGKKEGHQDGF